MNTVADKTCIELSPTTIRMKDGALEQRKLTLVYEPDPGWWVINGDDYLIGYCLHTLVESVSRDNGITLWAGDATWEHKDIAVTVLEAVEKIDKWCKYSVEGGAW